MAETNKEKESTVKTTTTKKTAPKKTPAKTTAPKQEKREITGDTTVTVYNNTHGGLIYEAKKGNGFLSFEEFMDSDELTVDELQQMRNGHRRVLEEGWIFVDDEEVLDYLRLTKVKESVKSPEVLTELLTGNSPTRIKEVVPTLSKSSQTTLHKELRKLFEDGTVSNIHIINAVEEALGLSQEQSLMNN